jgi:hypothetical protein
MGLGLIDSVWNGKYKLLTGPDSALSTTADDPWLFPATARAAALDTFNELVAFAKAWPKLTGYDPNLNKTPQWVSNELLKMFPGSDPTP